MAEKRKKMRENLSTNKKVRVLAERIRIKSAQEIFTNNLFKIYLTLTRRKYFSLQKTKNKNDKIGYYWLITE